VDAVIESIMDRVTEKDLIAAAKGIRDEWKRRAAEDSAREKEEMERKRVAIVGVSSANGVQGAKRKADEQAGGRPSPGPPGKG
jgi:mRNA guanylyltransferase